MEGGLVPSLNCKTSTLASAQGETERISKLYKSFCALGYLTMITYFFPQNLSFLEDPYCECVPWVIVLHGSIVDKKYVPICDSHPLLCKIVKIATSDIKDRGQSETWGYDWDTGLMALHFLWGAHPYHAYHALLPCVVHPPPCLVPTLQWCCSPPPP